MNYTKILFSAALIFNIYIIEAQSIVIKNAMIFDGINDNAFTGNILIEDGVIKKVSKSSIQGDTIIDAEGKIVTPGFIVSNTDIGIVEIGALSVTKDDQSSIYSIGFSIHDAFNPNSTRIPWNRSNGITSAITLPRDTSSPIGGLGSFFTLNGSLQIDSLPDMVMIGRIGGSSSSSRSEMLALTDDILSFASSLDVRDMKSNADINQIINDSPLADYLELQSRDVKALFRLIDDKLPLIIKANRATDILKLLEMKKKYNLNLIIMGAQEASLVAKQISSSNTPLIINPINNLE